MKQVNNNGHIYKPLMAGLFAGYFAAVLCVIFDVVFRSYTHYPLHELINVSTLIFAVLLVVPLAGCLYALLDLFFTKTAPVYLIITAVTFILLIYGIYQTHRSSDALLNQEFHSLMVGITVITGLATLAVPYFVKRSDLFMEEA
ncbi:hypothetical protein GCM10027051_13350 [Niabella terrae]